MVFVIHWHESAMDLHLFPIPIPPPASLSTRSLWVFPVHQGRALEADHQPRLDAWDKCSGPGNAWENKEALLNPRELTVTDFLASAFCLPHFPLRAPVWPAGRPSARGWKTSDQTCPPGSPSDPHSACTWRRRGSSPPRCWRCRASARAPRFAGRCGERGPAPAGPVGENHMLEGQCIGVSGRVAHPRGDQGSVT